MVPEHVSWAIVQTGRRPRRERSLVQRFLGHTDPGFTLRTYVHLLAEDLPEVPFGNLARARDIRRVA
jgi:integrase